MSRAPRQVFGLGKHQAAQAERGEAPILLEWPKDRFDDQLALRGTGPSQGDSLHPAASLGG